MRNDNLARGEGDYKQHLTNSFSFFTPYCDVYVTALRKLTGYTWKAWRDMKPRVNNATT